MGEGFEDEAAEVSAGMGDDEVGFVHEAVAVVNDVEVDFGDGVEEREGASGAIDRDGFDALGLDEAASDREGAEEVDACVQFGGTDAEVGPEGDADGDNSHGRDAALGLLDAVDDSGEGGGFVHSEVGEDFAVDFDLGLGEGLDEAAVGEVETADGGVDAGDPEVAEIALAGLAVTIGPVLALHGGILGVAEKFTAASAVSFGFLDDAFAAFA